MQLTAREEECKVLQDTVQSLSTLQAQPEGPTPASETIQVLEHERQGLENALVSKDDELLDMKNELLDSKLRVSELESVLCMKEELLEQRNGDSEQLKPAA